MCLDSLENYNECMLVHTEGDQEVQYNQVAASEKQLNNHSRLWAKMLNLGKDSDSMKQCKDTLVTEFNPVPVLAGLRKDHKQSDDPSIGPPLRPVCKARVAPNAALGNVVSQVVKGLAKELGNKVGTDSLSSEEICREVGDVNAKLRVAGSPDQVGTFALPGSTILRGRCWYQDTIME